MAAARDIITRVGDRTLTLTNLDKVLYPSVGFTKAEVIDYYARIAPVMLPHIRDRVMTRLRFPDGVGADRFSFYEKNAPMGTPDWVRRVNVRHQRRNHRLCRSRRRAGDRMAGQPCRARDARPAVDRRQRHAGGQHHQPPRADRGPENHWPTASLSTWIPGPA